MAGSTRLVGAVIALGAALCVGCQAPPKPAPAPVSDAELADRAHERGLEQLAVGLPQRAVRSFQRELQLVPTRHAAHFQLGLCYYRLGHYELEVAEYKKSLTIRPHLPHVLKNLGHAQFAADDLEGAKAAYEAYLALQPRDGEVLYNLGEIAVDLGDFEAARKLFQRCMEVGHDSKAADRLRELDRR